MEQQTPTEQIDWAAFDALVADLGETRQDPRDSSRLIVKAYGLALAQQYVEQAKQIQAQGGMPLPDGRGKRTLGGVFFSLVRQALGEETFVKVTLTPRERFLDRQRRNAERRARKAAARVEAGDAPVTR